MLGNPYVTDRPVTEEHPFATRYPILARVTQWLRQGRPIVFIYGPPRVGKTTFLRQLAADLAGDYTVVQIGFYWPADADPDSAIQQLQGAVGASLGAAGVQPVTDVSEPDAHMRRTVVLVDGLSVADLCREASPAMLSRWQDWAQGLPNTCFAVTVSGRPQGSIDCNTVATGLPTVELEGLALEETEELLQRPLKGRMAYDFDALRRVWEWSSGHPFFVQLFGRVLFDAHAGHGRIQAHDVESSVLAVVEASRPFFETVWQACSPQAQLVLAVSTGLRGRHGVVDARELRDAALMQGVELPAAVVQAGLSELLSVGVLGRLSQDTYSLFPAVLRNALAKYKPLAETLDELRRHKRLSSLPQRRPQGAMRWSSMGAWVGAVALLTTAIVLWNARGSGQRLVMGKSATPTPASVPTQDLTALGASVGRIVYMAKDASDATWDVWAMRGDGLDPKRLTDNPADDTAPAWSADGKQIVFVTDRDGNKEIYVIKADGTQAINLTHNAYDDETPACSPDGSAIAFSSYRDGNWEIYVMGTDGANPKRLTQSKGVDRSPSWSPDSGRIAFASNRDGNWEIYVMNADGTGIQRLTLDDATDSSPAWSPDGSTIAFESYRDGDMELYLMASADGADLKDVSNDHYSNEHAPAWARGSTRLLYYSSRDGGWDIFSMKPDGTEKSNLTLSVALEQSPAWHE